jgi:excinuclease ABC subunit A
LNVDIPLNQMTVITGPSGCGKSSLAFDTLHAEGKRRFMESLSSYARQFMEQYQKAAVEELTNIPPSIGLAQHNPVTNARATVGATIGTIDALSQLFYYKGERHCPSCDSLALLDGTAEALEAHLFAHVDVGSAIYLSASVLKKHVGSCYETMVKEGWSRVLGVDLKPVTFPEQPSRWGKPLLHEGDRICFLLDRFKRSSTATNEYLQRLRDVLKNLTHLSQHISHDKAALRLTLHIVDAQQQQTVLHIPLGHACLSCGETLVPLTPPHFHYMHAQGACPECEGYGRVMGLDEARVIPNVKETLRNGAVHPFRIPSYQELQDDLEYAARKASIPLDIPYDALSDQHKQSLWEGFPGFMGIRPYFKYLESKRYKMHVRMQLARYRGYFPCTACNGARLMAQSRVTRLGGKRYDAWVELPAQQLLAWLTSETGLKLDIDESVEQPKHVEDTYHAVLNSLQWLCDVGLGYLPLLRPLRSLSSGEAHRVQLIASVSSELAETLYVLDEPTVGLHPRDTQRLIHVLKQLVQLGNTLVLVEHDADVIKAANRVLDMGPEGGQHGGEIVFQGSYPELLLQSTRTAQGLTTPVQPITTEWMSNTHPSIRVYGARGFNLKSVSVRFPKQRLTCVTGVSGAGKTSLVIQTLYGSYLNSLGELPAFEVLPCDGIEGLEDMTGGVVLMDQSAPGRSARSNPATIVKAYDEIRKLFSESAKAKALGITAGHFSFNSKGGRCDTCEGLGTITIDMQFMADMHMECPECQGRRFKPTVLSVDLYGRTINDVLNMTVNEAFQFFKTAPKINKRLQVLRELGLGYLPLGQSTATLSGGEAQRLKLAPYLPLQDKPVSKPGVFIFDEPTRGLHLTDIPLLVHALRRLVQVGHTVIVIEHNPTFILTASDWVIDIGPEADVDGGDVVYEGTLEGFITSDNTLMKSFTQVALKQTMNPEMSLAV